MIENLFELALDVTIKAGEILKEGFGSTFQINNKEGRNNLVTEFDLKSEEFIISSISKYHPSHTFLAEESGLTKSGSASRWILDPLDGTVNFAHNVPLFSISLAYEFEGNVQFGIVYNPILNELFFAEKGKGAYFNHNKVAVSSNDTFETAFLVTGFPYNINENPDNCLSHFHKVLSYGIPVRRLGSAAIDLAYVACGRFDGFWEVSLNPWDVAAGMLIVEEAGGNVTNYKGEKFHQYDKSLIATNGLIHNNILEIVQS
jgi:myo-inositol-1(or 4)-monophosphatase